MPFHQLTLSPLPISLGLCCASSFVKIVAKVYKIMLNPSILSYSPCNELSEENLPCTLYMNWKLLSLNAHIALISEIQMQSSNNNSALVGDNWDWLGKILFFFCMSQCQCSVALKVAWWIMSKSKRRQKNLFKNLYQLRHNYTLAKSSEKFLPLLPTQLVE